MNLKEFEPLLTKQSFNYDLILPISEQTNSTNPNAQILNFDLPVRIPKSINAPKLKKNSKMSTQHETERTNQISTNIRCNFCSAIANTLFCCTVDKRSEKVSDSH